MEKNNHAECGAHCKKSNPNSPESPRKEKKAEMKNCILAGGQDAHDNLLALATQVNRFCALVLAMQVSREHDWHKQFPISA